MKKLTPRYKRWLLHRNRTSKKASRRAIKGGFGGKHIHGAHQVDAWLGDRSEKVIARQPPVIPPATLCLTENPEETLNFLASVRSSMQLKDALTNPGKYVWLSNAKTPNGLRRMRAYADYSSIETLSTSTALIMTAEYHRAANILGSAPPAINLHTWSDGAFLPLFQIGFFEAIGNLEATVNGLQDKGSIVYLRAVSGTGGADLEAVSKELMELSKSLEGSQLSRELRLDLNNAIGEAMVNVSKWAYPEDHDYIVPHLGKFWVTGSVDKRSNLLTIVIYDQGVTIPVSYPKKRLKQQAIDYLKGLLRLDSAFDFENDSAYIDCAMRFGHSQSGKEYRGQGLPQMKELIDRFGGGSLTICSRGGIWHYDHGKSALRTSFPVSVGGTLIEWKIAVPRDSRND